MPEPTYPDLELVLRVKGGPEVAVVPYDGEKYITKVLANFQRSEVLPKFIQKPNAKGQPELVENPVTPGKAVALAVVEAFNQIATREDQMKIQDAVAADQKKPEDWAALVDIKVDLGNLLGG